jgi:glucose-6-phosphate-specific signal transduction histidine kinase
MNNVLLTIPVSQTNIRIIFFCTLGITIHHIDEVFNLDRLKQRLTKNMEDRKAEVDIRQEIQKREMIAEELHDLKLKRQNLIIKIDKVQFVKFYNLNKIVNF